MVKGEKRCETKARIHEYITILFNEFKQQHLTLDEIVIIFNDKYDIAIKKPSVNEYVLKMRKHLKFNITKNNNKFNAYKIEGDQKLDLELIWPSKIKETTGKAKSVDDYYVKFNPPRSPLINKLFGLAA